MDDEPLRAFGHRVAALRASRKMTQRDVARLAGLDLTTVSRIERGIGDTTPSMMVVLAHALGVRVVDLVGEDALPARPTIEIEVAELRAKIEEAVAIAREALRIASEVRDRES